eukprot:6470604-Amphidinium_carterae.1
MYSAGHLCNWGCSTSAHLRCLSATQARGCPGTPDAEVDGKYGEGLHNLVLSFSTTWWLPKTSPNAVKP